MSNQGFSQQQKLLQKQIASQQTIQLMRMIEMPNISLEQEILKEVEENPALEIDQEDGKPEYENDPEFETTDFDIPQEECDENDISEQEIDRAYDENLFDNDFYNDNDDDYYEERELNYQLQNINVSKDDESRERVVVFDTTLQENLLIQIGEMDIADHERGIAEYIIGNLDDTGYLLRDNKAISNDLLLSFNLYTTPNEIEKIITQYIHELDPPGIGARNLQECLLIQLRKEEQSASVKLAICILQNYFDEFSKKHYEKLCKSLSVNDTVLKRALDEIKILSPRPASNASCIDNASFFVNPDFIIILNGDKLELTLNNNYIPKVKINKNFRKEYRFLSEEMNLKKRAEAEKFIKENLDNAANFINTLTLREITLYQVMYTIMMMQKQYFITGRDTDLKPMILKDIADKVNMDISTISRVSNSKYVQTHFGTIPLKHLFSESIGKEDISSKEVKKILSEVIEKEDKKSPLPDEQLCALLQDKGYHIARRTVAKYREHLGFPIARLRREIGA